MNTILQERAIQSEIRKAQSSLVAIAGEDTPQIAAAINAYEVTLRANPSNAYQMTERIVKKLQSWRAQHDASGVWFQLSTRGIAAAFQVAISEGLTDRNAYELREIIHSLNRADSFEEISE